MPEPITDNPFLHFCEEPGCDRWGAFGFHVRLRAGHRGRWFCREHRPEGKS